MPINQILNIAYGTSPYNSVVCVGCHKKGTDGIYTLAYIPTAELDPEKIKIKKDRDYYITANTLTKRERKNENLFSLRNIVIDIDCHTEIPNYERDELLQEFIFRMYRDCEIPTPNIIHYTGRGLQLWWCLEEMSRELLFLYKITIKKIIDRLEQLKTEYKYFDVLEIDGASKNAVGFFRLFDSYNTKTGTKTTTIIKRAEKYKIHFLLENIEVIEPEEVPQKQQRAVIDGNYTALNYKRTNFIKWLIQERKAPAGCETRDKILFLFYNAAVQYETREEAKKHTKKLNQTFREPLDRIDNIFSYIDEKGFLKFKNETWLDFLGVNDNERSRYTMQELKSNTTRDIKRKMSKDERNTKILKMKNDGKTNIDIAKILGIAPRTVYNVLNENNWKDNKPEKIEEYRAKGLKIAEICKILGISKQTYYNILKKGD